MTEPLILDPLPGDRAFRDDSSEAAWSQAAQLIGLGVQLRGDGTLLEGLASEVERLKLPKVSAIELMEPATLTENLRSGHYFFEQGSRYIEPDSYPFSRYIRWETLFLSTEPDPMHAVALLYASLFSRREINRVAAAVALQPLLTELP